VVGSLPLKGGEIGMTEFQTLTFMIAFGSLVAAIIFGLLTVIIGILNLTIKK
jgi:vacuolar-type H+-ATPase subunit I/STV1